ncbi:ATP-binding protein [Methylobacter sp.]|uniref:AAA family ATPase n=1 Tax=Methylobacter sp. TaxID=2051955 RepID=UPI00120349CE|nr:ATP-binding protein [Methylobacter sp.]TAK61298.1 MAG: ATP-binding protein [Methylobacter sp.]
MLIEFSVSNFRSFREKQTFSMVAAPHLKKGDKVFKPVVKGEKLPDLLKVAAIYGPNASGKSNLIKAFDIVRDVAGRQPSAQATPLPVSPFRFDPLLASQPSCIELHFVHAEQRYQFELALTQQRIVEECLIAFPAGKETLLYKRRHLPSGDEYSFGPKLEGGTALHELWRKSTGPQVLFLAQAVANSSEDLNQLRDPLKWLQTGIMTVSGKMGKWAVGSQQLAKRFPSIAKEISSFLQEVDVPVSTIRFDQVDSDALEQAQEDLLPLPDENPKSRTILTHKTALGEADFDFKEESEGTKNLIGFWFPWSVHSRSKLTNESRTLVVDELDSSLHPEIVVSLVKKHLQSDLPGQLIFTTHDTHLMDAKLLRRDQFWLTERDVNGATQLRSIHDFEGREGEDLEKRYYEGRYRGLPILRKG